MKLNNILILIILTISALYLYNIYYNPKPDLELNLNNMFKNVTEDYMYNNISTLLNSGQFIYYDGNINYYNNNFSIFFSDGRLYNIIYNISNSSSCESYTSTLGFQKENSIFINIYSIYNMFNSTNSDYYYTISNIFMHELFHLLMYRGIYDKYYLRYYFNISVDNGIISNKDFFISKFNNLTSYLADHNNLNSYYYVNLWSVNFTRVYNTSISCYSGPDLFDETIVRILAYCINYNPETKLYEYDYNLDFCKFRDFKFNDYYLDLLNSLLYTLPKNYQNKNYVKYYKFNYSNNSFIEVSDNN